MNLADFKNLFFIHSTVDQAAIIAKYLEHKCFVTKGKILYELTEDKSYDKTTGLQVQNKLLIIVAKLISESDNKLDEVEKTELSSIKKWSTVTFPWNCKKRITRILLWIDPRSNRWRGSGGGYLTQVLRWNTTSRRRIFPQTKY
jgi:hypothetical protein